VFNRERVRRRYKKCTEMMLLFLASARSQILARTPAPSSGAPLALPLPTHTSSYRALTLTPSACALTVGGLGLTRLTRDLFTGNRQVIETQLLSSGTETLKSVATGCQSRTNKSSTCRVLYGSSAAYSIAGLAPLP
jgi:hypothetical protein